MSETNNGVARPGVADSKRTGAALPAPDDVEDVLARARFLHLDKDDLVHWVEGRLDPLNLARVRAHLERCVLCESRVSSRSANANGGNDVAFDSDGWARQDLAGVGSLVRADAPMAMAPTLESLTTIRARRVELILEYLERLEARVTGAGFLSPVALTGQRSRILRSVRTARELLHARSCPVERIKLPIYLSKEEFYKHFRNSADPSEDGRAIDTIGRMLEDRSQLSPDLVPWIKRRVASKEGNVNVFIGPKLPRPWKTIVEDLIGKDSIDVARWPVLAWATLAVLTVGAFGALWPRVSTAPEQIRTAAPETASVPAQSSGVRLGSANPRLASAQQLTSSASDSVLPMSPASVSSAPSPSAATNALRSAVDSTSAATGTSAVDVSSPTASTAVSPMAGAPTQPVPGASEGTVSERVLNAPDPDTLREILRIVQRQRDVIVEFCPLNGRPNPAGFVKVRERIGGDSLGLLVERLGDSTPAALAVSLKLYGAELQCLQGEGGLSASYCRGGGPAVRDNRATRACNETRATQEKLLQELGKAERDATGRLPGDVQP